MDNEAVFHLLEEATRNTAYAPSLATFAKKHDGRGAYFAIMSQYAGEDKWLAEVKVQEKFMATEWKGQSNFSLEALITQHRNAFTSLQECAEHTSYQLLTEEGRVRKLIDCIVSTNADLCAAVAHVKASAALKTDFEKAAAFLLPACPVAAKRARIKRGAAEISEVEGNVPAKPTIASTESKAGFGRTGVHLRWHDFDEYGTLNAEQKKELYEWRQANPEAAKRGRKQPKKGKGRPKSYTQKQIASIINKAVATAKGQPAKPEPTPPTDTDRNADVMSVLTELVAVEVKKAVGAGSGDVSSTTVSNPDPKPDDGKPNLSMLHAIIQKASTAKQE